MIRLATHEVSNLQDAESGVRFEVFSSVEWTHSVRWQSNIPNWFFVVWIINDQTYEIRRIVLNIDNILYSHTYENISNQNSKMFSTSKQIKNSQLQQCQIELLEVSSTQFPQCFDKQDAKKMFIFWGKQFCFEYLFSFTYIPSFSQNQFEIKSAIRFY